jgi:hypothetical protein
VRVFILTRKKIDIEVIRTIGRKQKEKTMFWMIVVLSLFFAGDSVKIGKIQNAIVISIINNSLSNITGDQCICQMMKSNELLSAVNYFQINQTCQLYSSNITSVTIEFNLYSDFIFVNQSLITITTVQSNSEFIHILNCINFLFFRRLRRS